MRTRSPLIVLPPLSMWSSTGELRVLAPSDDRLTRVLIFVPDLDESLPTIEPFDRRLDEFLESYSQVLVVAEEPTDDLTRFARSHHLALELLSDPDGELSAELNLEFASRPVLLLVDEHGVVRESTGHPNIHVDGVLDCVRRLMAA